MKYIKVRNLEKYQDGYKDRRHQWAKIFLELVIGDQDAEQLDEIDFARLIKFIVLETCTQRPTPLDEKYLSKRNFDPTLRDFNVSLANLSHFIEIIDVTEESNLRNGSLHSYVENRPLDTIRVDTTREEYICHSKLKDLWNETCKSLPQVKELSKSRINKIKLRLKERGLDSWGVIFAKIEASDFCKGKKGDGWRATFDWIIENDHNALKVLEGKYDGKSRSSANSNAMAIPPRFLVSGDSAGNPKSEKELHTAMQGN